MQQHELVKKLKELSKPDVEKTLTRLLKDGNIADYDDEIANRIRDAAELCSLVKEVITILESRDAFDRVVEDELVLCHVAKSETPRDTLLRLINWHVLNALDPSVSKDAQNLIDKGRQERLSEEPVAEVKMRITGGETYELYVQFLDVESLPVPGDKLYLGLIK
jgi:hypothetical protein